MTCPICNDEKAISQPDGSRIECSCQLIARFKSYLGEWNRSGVQTVSLDLKTYARNLLFEDFFANRFNRLVASFLAQSFVGPKFSHKAVSGHDIIQAYFSNGGNVSELQTVPFLIINLGIDPPNSFYSQTLEAFLEERSRNAKCFTWVNSRYDVTSQTFSKIYQPELAAYLTAPMMKEVEGSALPQPRMRTDGTPVIRFQRIPKNLKI